MKQVIFTKKEITKIKELYSKGLSCTGIAKIINVSKTPIIRILKTEGLLKKGNSDGKQISRFTKQYETKQLAKLKWVNENIKPVEILVVDKRNNEVIKKNIL
jgi:predicted DNA-binding protein YlxM (UPF0122 family)